MLDLDAQLRAWTSGFGMPWEGLCRLVLAAIVSGAIGLERELRGRQAGFRTNILISVGAALVMIVSISFTQRDWPHAANFSVQVDPSHLSYGVMTGMGLLCAGVIIKDGFRVRGMTTASGLWCSTAIGLSSGFGLYVLTLGAGVLILIVLWLLQYAEASLPRTRYARLTLRRAWSHDCLASTLREIEQTGLKVRDIDFERSADLKTVQIHIELAIRERIEFEVLSQKTETNPNLELMAAQNL